MAEHVRAVQQELKVTLEREAARRQAILMRGAAERYRSLVNALVDAAWLGAGFKEPEEMFWRNVVNKTIRQKIEYINRQEGKQRQPDDAVTVQRRNRQQYLRKADREYKRQRLA